MGPAPMIMMDWMSVLFGMAAPKRICANSLRYTGRAARRKAVRSIEWITTKRDRHALAVSGGGDHRRGDRNDRAESDRRLHADRADRHHNTRLWDRVLFPWTGAAHGARR